MNIRNLNEVRKLLAELERLETAQDILKNYDAEVSANFWTGHNHNKGRAKEIRIPVSQKIKDDIIEEINDRIAEINEELEKM